MVRISDQRDFALENYFYAKLFKVACRDDHLIRNEVTCTERLPFFLWVKSPTEIIQDDELSLELLNL